ncbi:MAG: putative metal-binding protein [Gemmatimonadota bacterium]
MTTLSPDPTGVFNGGAHPATGRPFVCMRGSREYHAHPSHIAELWEGIRRSSAYDLGGILTQLWHAWQKGSG